MAIQTGGVGNIDGTVRIEPNSPGPVAGYQSVVRGASGSQLRMIKRPFHRMRNSIALHTAVREGADPKPWEQIVAEIRTISPECVGVDVFDTVLTRRLATDEAVTRVVGLRAIRHRLWHSTIESWMAARSRAYALDPHGTLSDWFYGPAYAEAASPEALINLEIATERELIEPVEGAAEALAAIREISRIHFVSDMHLGSETLRALLNSHGLIGPNDQLTVSCEIGSTKSDGTLYETLWPRKNTADKTVVFVGNNAWSDGAKAARAGLETVAATAANLSVSEQIMAQRASAPGLAIAAAARDARIGYLNDNQHRPLEAHGTQVGGQALLAFALWISDVVTAEGISDVRFLARDGELPLRIARAMKSDHWSGVNLEYLHCGRRSWSLAGAGAVGVAPWIEVGTRDADSFLVHSSKWIPFRTTLERCGLTVSDLAKDSELSRWSPDQPLGAAGSELWRDLLTSGELDEAISERAHGAKQLVTDYLRQIELPSERLALVDVGWRGQLAWMTGAVIAEVTGVAPIHLHFGGDGVSESLSKIVDIRRFALDDSKAPHPISAPVSCLEMLLGSGKPRLLGYERNDQGVVSQIFSDTTGRNHEFSERLAQAAISVAQHFPSRGQLDSWGIDHTSLAPEVRELLKNFWNNPDREVAELHSEMEFELDDSGDRFSKVVRSYKLSEIAKGESHRTWPEASLVMSRPPVRSMVKTCRAVRNLVRR